MRASLLGGVALLLLTSSSVLAQSRPEYPWLIRVRGIAIVPDASSSPAGLDVESDATIELDISYAFHRLFSLELVAATAAQEVTSPTGSLGAVNHVPPTLLLQFHPVSTGIVRPYLGGGGNVTYFYNKSGALQDFDLDTSVGWAAQAGVDLALNRRAVFNIDAKYIKIGTDVKLNGVQQFDLDIDPVVIGVGFGYRF